MLHYWDHLCWNGGTVLFTAKTFCYMLQGILIELYTCACVYLTVLYHN